MSRIEEIIDLLSRMNWLEFGRSAFLAFSCLTVVFAFYILYFDRSAFVFISAFSYINFIFFTSILLTVSLGLARLLLFFLEQYIIPLIESMVILIVSVVAIFLAKLYARIDLKFINKIGVDALKLGDDVRDKLGNARKILCNPIAPFILGTLIFMFIYLEGVVLKGSVIFLAILFIGYFVFSLNLAYGAKIDPEKPEVTEEIDQNIVNVLRSTAEDLLDVQRDLTIGITRSILLQQKLDDIYPVLFNVMNIKSFFIRFWGLIFLVSSAALGYLRGEVVERSSLYSVVLLQPQNESEYKTLNISIFLTTNSAVLAKEVYSDDVLVIPYDAIGALTSQRSKFPDYSSGFSGGGGF